MCRYFEPEKKHGNPMEALTFFWIFRGRRRALNTPKAYIYMRIITLLYNTIILEKPFILLYMLVPYCIAI